MYCLEDIIIILGECVAKRKWNRTVKKLNNSDYSWKDRIIYQFKLQYKQKFQPWAWTTKSRPKGKI